MIPRSLIFAAAALLAAPCVALADDGTRPQSPSEPAGAASTQVTLLGEGATAMRFRVSRDAASRRLTFRLLDRRARLGLPPVVVLRTAQGPREVTLTPVEGETDCWSCTDEAALVEPLDATLRVTVDGKAISGPVVVESAEAALVAPSHGGRWLHFDECGFLMEVAQDFESGTLTFYGPSRGHLDRPPAVTITEGGGVTMSEAAVVEGKQATWKFSSSAFKKRETVARVRVLVDGRACEAALTLPPHGGRIVVAAGGPQVEIVRAGSALRVFVLEDRIGEKPLALETPMVFVTTAEGDRTFPLVAIVGETRAWEVASFDAPPASLRKVRLRFTNAGKIIETDLSPVFVVATTK